MKASVTPRKCETSTQHHSIAVNMVNADGGNFVASGNREAGCYKLGLLSLCNQVKSDSIDDHSAAAIGRRETDDGRTRRVHIGEVSISPIHVLGSSILPSCILPPHLPTVFREVTTRGEQ